MDFPWRWTEQPKLNRPVLIAAFEGWNDAGNAASGAARYLARSWEARTFGEMDPEEFYDFTTTRPEVRLEGGGRKIKWPANTLAASAVPGCQHDAVFLHGAEPQLRWRHFCDAVTEAIRGLGVELVISLGALLAEVPHSRPVKVTGTTADPELAVRLGLQRSNYEGPTGIVGVLHDSVGRKGIPATSMWAGVPHYLAQTPSPKATLALVSRTADLLGARVETTELEIATASYERQVSELISADDEASAYVAQLEEADALAEGADEAVAGDLEQTSPAPSGEALAAEVERFLREHHRD